MHKGKLRVIRRNSDVANNVAWELARYKQELSAEKVRNNTLKKGMSVVEVAAFTAGNVTKSAEQVTASTLMAEFTVRKGVSYPKMAADLKRGDTRCVKMCLFSMGCETTTILLV